MRRILLALTFAAMLPLATQAQRYFGIATSNWSGTNSLYLNPANIADSRHKFTVDLFSLNFSLDNSLAAIDFSQATKTSGDFSKAFTFGTKDEFSIMAPIAEVRGPGFMVSLGPKHSIGLTTRARAVAQFHNFNQNLYRLFTDTTLDDVSAGKQLQAKDFNATIHGWSEIGLTYGGVIYEKGQHMVKGGFTVRYLMGAAYVSVLSKNINAQYNYIPNTDATLTLTNTDFQYSQANATGLINDGDINSLLGGNTGKGIGGDLGVVYEWRPKNTTYTYDMDGKTGIIDRSKNSYTLRFSAAVTDLGSIKYKSSDNIVFNTNAATPTVIKGTEIVDKIGDTTALSQYLTSRGMTAKRGASETKVMMPTMVVIGLDYHAIKNVYVNATYMANMAAHDKPGNAFYSQLTITPRYDTRVFSVGIPFTYSMLSSSMKVGAGVRVGGFFFGSDDIIPIGDRYSANFYFGASVPINKKKPRDSDGDGVSNRKDKCRNEKGVWEMKGCPNPDKDGDGVLDKDDMCPDVAGSKTAKGCPDADLDGVADAEDRCPEAAGSAGMQGCPDRDGDGVADIDDVCPDQPGLAQFKGCPDSDNDGIADNEDKCPNAAGPIANQGCPDSDNDGVADNADKCPTVAGTIANNGCPEVSVEVKKRLAFAATAIQFETGKAAIKKTSYKMLDEIVKILNDYPDYNMTIEGHSDNVGNAIKNMQLSKDRANAVKNYYVAKGIAANRLSAGGFGDTKPVASNKTAAGRAKNRRVAMDLKLKD